jgi:predicted nucleic acid-binding protein
MNLVDSSGWLEYFIEGINAEEFSKVIENTDKLIVTPINIYEVYKKISQEKNIETAFLAIGAMNQGKIINIDNEIALNAAQLSIEFKLAMADSLILSCAYYSNAILWTQDSDFKDIPGVKFIKK